VASSFLKACFSCGEDPSQVQEGIFIVHFAFSCYQDFANHLLLHHLLLNADIVGIVQEVIGSSGFLFYIIC
jgi:hypothetical protein